MINLGPILIWRLIQFEQNLSPLRSTVARLHRTFLKMMTLSFLFLIATYIGSYHIAGFLGYRGDVSYIVFVIAVLFVATIVFGTLSLINSLIKISRLRSNIASIAIVSLPMLLAFTAGYVAYQMLTSRQTHLLEWEYFAVLLMFDEIMSAGFA